MAVVVEKPRLKSTKWLTQTPEPLFSSCLYFGLKEAVVLGAQWLDCKEQAVFLHSMSDAPKCIPSYT